MSLEWLEWTVMLAPQHCVKTSAVTRSLALGGHLSEEAPLDLRVARSSPPISLSAPGPRRTVLIITPCVASDSGLKGESLGVAPVDPTAWAFHSLWFFFFFPCSSLSQSWTS